jgi:hypothetical protein
MSMSTCHDLAAMIEDLHPHARPRDVARLCLLLTNQIEDLTEIADQDRLTEVWHQMGLRLQVASDQHAAMTAELEELARTRPESLSADQIATLLRAIKVQSQVLQFYLGRVHHR